MGSFALYSVTCCRGQVAGLAHRPEHIPVALEDALGVVLVGRVVEARIVDHAGQEGGLRHGEVLGVGLEVGLAGGLQPVRAVPEVDRVQVAREDLVLAQLFVDLVRQEQLAELAGQGLIGGEVEDLDVLLGDRRAALELSAAGDRPGGPEHAADRDPLVGPERAVLRGDDGLLHVLGHLVGLHRLPVLDRERAELGLAVVVVDEGGRGLEVRVGVGPVGGPVADEHDGDHADQTECGDDTDALERPEGVPATS